MKSNSLISHQRMVRDRGNNAKRHWREFRPTLFAFGRRRFPSILWRVVGRILGADSSIETGVTTWRCVGKTNIDSINSPLEFLYTPNVVDRENPNRHDSSRRRESTRAERSCRILLANVNDRKIKRFDKVVDRNRRDDVEIRSPNRFHS